MRKIALNAFIVFLSTLAGAQGVFTNETHSILQQVIRDYPAGFSQIRGKLLSKSEGATYYSTLSIPGSLNAVIKQYGSEFYCWQNDLYSSSHFELAKIRYKEVYDNLKNSIVKIEGQQPFILSGNYQAPEEDKKRNTVVYRPIPASAAITRLSVMLCLHYKGKEWVVTLSVLDTDSPLHEPEEKITANEAAGAH